MKYASALLVLAAFQLTACDSKETGSNSPASPPPAGSSPSADSKKPADQSKPVAPVAPVAPGARATAHVLQITALNFLIGGLEPCNVEDKQYPFSESDRGVETLICLNSKSKVYAVSDSGTVTFHAMDLVAEREMEAGTGTEGSAFDLGKTENLRFSAKNPYGFTYLIIGEVTGIDPQLLAEWNEQNAKLADLRAQYLTAQQNGEPVSDELMKKITDLETKMSELSKKMESSRKKS